MTVLCRWFEVDGMICNFICILRLFLSGTDFRDDWLAASLDSMSHYMRMLFAATEALHLQCKRRGTNCPFGSWEFILDCIFLVLQFLNQCRYYYSPATWLAQLFTITWLAAQNDSTVGSVCTAIFSCKTIRPQGTHPYQLKLVTWGRWISSVLSSHRINSMLKL